MIGEEKIGLSTFEESVMKSIPSPSKIFIHALTFILGCE